MFTTGLSGYERRNAAQRKKSVRGQRSNSLMTQKYWHLRGTIVLCVCVRASVCVTIKACTRAAYEKLRASEDSPPPKHTYHSGWGPIPLFFYVHFGVWRWKKVMEMQNSFLGCFFTLARGGFWFSRERVNAQTGRCRKSFDIANIELKCQLFTPTVSFLVATTTIDMCPPIGDWKISGLIREKFWNIPNINLPSCTLPRRPLASAL